MDCGDEFLTLPELTARIKFSQQTIYNMISSKRLIKGQHYLTKQFISKAPYLRGIPQVGLIEEVAYLLRSALQGLQVVAHL
ncbi:MAG: hypothetical protein ABSD38_12925, partial [Syntrophorhabdales bacterium]